MNYNIWVVADYHFGHEGPYTNFKRADGTPLRPFSCSSDADEYMVDEHNKLVKDNDRVYVLGDITFNRRYLPLLNRMKGRKVLIRGNHDEEPLAKYAQYFEDVRGVVAKNGYVMTHVPIHPESLGRWGFNIHGHLHANRVLLADGTIDTRYLCVSVEHTNYKPMLLSEALKKKPSSDSS